MIRAVLAAGLLAAGALLISCDEDETGCDIRASDVVDVAPPEGYAFHRAAENELSRFPELDREHATVRVITRRGTRVAIAYAASGRDPDDWVDELSQGSIGDVKPRPVDLGTQTGIHLPISQPRLLAEAVIGSHGCASFVVMAYELGPAMAVAKALAAHAP